MTTLLVVLALVTSVMVVVNLLTNLWARQHYLVISLWATGVLLAVAWLAGITWSQLGLGFGGNAQTKGLIWSAALIGIVSVGYAIAAALPWTRKGFADARTAQMGVGSSSTTASCASPWARPLMEEVAFRGVLLAALTEAWGVIWGWRCRRCCSASGTCCPPWSFTRRPRRPTVSGTGARRSS